MNMPAYLILISFLLLQTGCNLLGGDPKETELEPGPRNYTWIVDSVYSAPGGWMNTIWGSSPNDVWIASSGGFDKLWHYDGNEWTPWPSREGPNSFTGDFYSIFGFAQDDVWMGGRGPSGGGIWHYDGNEWEEAYIYSSPGMAAATILDIWGESQTDIYAVGTIPSQSGEIYKGFILHYDGKDWREVLITNFGVQFQVIRKGSQGTFIRAAGPYVDQLDGQVTIYRLKDGEIHEILSSAQKELDHLLWINTIGKDIFLVDGYNLEKYKGDRLLNLNEDTSAETVFSFWGRHAKDILLITTDGILHYNGIDIQLIYDSGAQPSFVLFEKDVFFFANDYAAGTNVIYHGTLTEQQED